MRKKSSLLFLIVCLSIRSVFYAQNVDGETVSTNEVKSLTNIVNESSKRTISEAPKANRTFQKRYKDVYLRNSKFDYKEKEPGFLFKLKQWLNEFLERWLLQNARKTNSSKVMNYVKLVFYSGFVILAIYIIVTLVLKKQFTWLFKKAARKNKMVYDSELEDLNELKFEQLINKALKNSNYRMAVRYYFLWTLNLLDTNQIIQYHPEKTNKDYLNELEETELNKLFQKVSKNYIYIWYGEFEITEDEFQLARDLSLQIINQFDK